VSADEGGAVCGVCFRHCRPAEGSLGACRARRARGGEVVCDNYGRITSLALDPIEKKPLARFHPGSVILSVGSYGCNLSCPFCQNDSISYAGPDDVYYRTVSPEELVGAALSAKGRGNVGIAFTYNEPLVGWEFVRDTAKLAHMNGLLNVMVTNGCAELSVLEELLPYIDAMNIDLKCFTDDCYRRLGGDFDTVKAFIARACEDCHVELTTLIVPGLNDSEDDMGREAAWIASLKGGRGADVPLHVTRFFPRHDYVGKDPTDVRTVRALADKARETLKYVYVGNCW
jgi:pyruvate formate lyase activating enzyme